MLETLQSLDKELFIFLNGLHAPYWDHFAATFTGKLPWGAMYATILIVLFGELKWQRAAVAACFFIVLIVISDQLASSILRPLFERPRPSHDEGLMDMVHLVNGRRGGAFGFPSAHAANTAALTTFAICYFRNRGLSIFLIAWTLATCYTRIYIGVHYPGDVIAGIVTGSLVAAFVYGMYRLVQPRPARFAAAPLVSIVGVATVAVIAVYSFFH